jgi:hypothetical protein
MKRFLNTVFDCAVCSSVVRTFAAPIAAAGVKEDLDGVTPTEAAQPPAGLANQRLASARALDWQIRTHRLQALCDLKKGRKQKKDS